MVADSGLKPGFRANGGCVEDRRASLAGLPLAEIKRTEGSHSAKGNPASGAKRQSSSAIRLHDNAADRYRGGVPRNR